MRSGQYINALGRRSFEPSPRSNPNPAHTSTTDTSDGDVETSSDPNTPTPAEISQDRQRALVKAQNDVLATIGVCLHETKRDLVDRENQVAENEAGLLVGALDLVGTYVASWPLVGIRNRMQTYRQRGDVGYLEILGDNWRRYSVRVLFAGMPAHLVFQVAKLASDYGQTEVLRWVKRRKWFRKLRGRRRKEWALRIVDYTLQFTTWIFLYPLYRHSNLQVLHLIGVSPMLPHWLSFVPFSSYSPYTLPFLSDAAGPILSIRTLKAVTYKLLSSTFFHSFLLQSLSVWAHFHFYNKLSNLLPRPDTSYPTHRTSTSNLLTTPTPSPPSSPPIQAIEPIEIETTVITSPIIPNPTDPQSRFLDSIEIAAVGSDDVQHSHLSGGSTIQQRTYTASPIPESTTPQENPILDTETEDPIPTSQPSPTRRDRSASPSPEPQPTSIPASSAPPAPVKQYRTSTLAVHPVDTVSGHLSDFLANIICFPLETIIMRTLAREALMGMGIWGMEGEGLDYAVPKPWNFRIGTGSASAVKAMVVGEGALGWGMFQLSWGLARWVGGRWFGYGK